MPERAYPLQDRLETLDSVRKAGISVCAGGIIGMGEANMDRVGLLHQLATLPEHPESVPINALVAVKGTPLQVGEQHLELGNCSSQDIASQCPDYICDFCLLEKTPRTVGVSNS